jgi:4-hydroxy-3-methylbut-2-enyl diphosphate reductase IspH
MYGSKNANRCFTIATERSQQEMDVQARLGIKEKFLKKCYTVGEMAST